MTQRKVEAPEVHVDGVAAHVGVLHVSKALQLQRILPWVTLRTCVAAAGQAQGSERIRECTILVLFAAQGGCVFRGNDDDDDDDDDAC
eukprot:scaffold138875_cov24-Tisochrysis_lutea.AAC.1